MQQTAFSGGVMIGLLGLATALSAALHWLLQFMLSNGL